VKRDDEIGELARSFAKMVTYLKEMAPSPKRSRAAPYGAGQAAFRARHAGQRLRKDVEAWASWCAARATLRHRWRAPATSSERVRRFGEDRTAASSAIDEVTSTMHEMSVNVQNMVKSTQVQASSVSETSASIDQMVASIQRVATPPRCCSTSRTARAKKFTAHHTMEKATDAEPHQRTITSSGEIIGALGQRADDIGKIIEVIDDLAEQTNLLALTQHRSGARRRAWTRIRMVADEVRKLRKSRRNRPRKSRS